MRHDNFRQYLREVNNFVYNKYKIGGYTSLTGEYCWLYYYENGYSPEESLEDCDIEWLEKESKIWQSYANQKR